jgi:DNA-binding response OmpR family regulator
LNPGSEKEQLQLSPYPFTAGKERVGQMGKKILCIEDNPQAQMINKAMLEARGFAVELAMTFCEAREAVAEEMPDLIILDIHLPTGNGLDFLRELRKTSSVPVIALTNSKEEQFIMDVYASGCDDYIHKPYTISVLCAQIESLLRRTEHIPDTITKGDLTLRVNSNQAFVNGKDIRLSKDIEFSLLCIFTQNEETILSAECLYEKAWGHPLAGNTQALSSAVKRLRGKLKGSGYTLANEYGIGYVFRKE